MQTKLTPYEMSFLEIDNVNVGFGPVSSRTEVLKNINLSVKENEFVAIIGFSGSGKSTLINLLAGLQAPDTGEVRLNGNITKGPGPDRGIMFQNYSLLPWLTVYENIELAALTNFQAECDSEPHSLAPWHLSPKFSSSTSHSPLSMPSPVLTFRTKFSKSGKKTSAPSS